MVRRKIRKLKSKRIFAKSFKKGIKRRARNRKARSVFRGGYRL